MITADCSGAGIFRPLEKLSDVRSFLSEVLEDQTKTFSFSMLGKTFSDEQLTLAALNMVRCELGKPQNHCNGIRKVGPLSAH